MRPGKKGFVRIMETVIASIIILTSLSFFFTATPKQSGWDDTLSEIRALDAISVGYKSGQIPTFVRNNDDAGMRGFLENLFTRSTEFSSEVTGIPNPIIYVGCSCSEAETDDIRARLYPLTFDYKGRQIEIRIEEIVPSNYPPETNIMLFTDFSGAGTYTLASQYQNYRASIDQFLQDGGTIFLLDDLTESDVSTMSPNIAYLMQNILGVEWLDDSGIQATARLDGYEEPTRITHNIAKYYANISGNDPSANIGNFNIAGSVNMIQYDPLKTIVETANKKFSFVQANRGVINGNGRSIWMAGNGGSEQLNNLTKALVMWGSGESYKMDGGVKRVPGLINRKASIIIYDEDTYEFELTTWNVF